MIVAIPPIRVLPLPKRLCPGSEAEAEAETEHESKAEVIYREARLDMKPASPTPTYHQGRRSWGEGVHGTLYV
jgi:hypothetical protein